MQFRLCADKQSLIYSTWAEEVRYHMSITLQQPPSHGKRLNRNINSASALLWYELLSDCGHAIFETFTLSWLGESGSMVMPNCDVSCKHAKAKQALAIFSRSWTCLFLLTQSPWLRTQHSAQANEYVAIAWQSLSSMNVVRIYSLSLYFPLCHSIEELANIDRIAGTCVEVSLLRDQVTDHLCWIQRGMTGARV